MSIMLNCARCGDLTNQSFSFDIDIPSISICDDCVNNSRLEIITKIRIGLQRNKNKTKHKQTYEKWCDALKLKRL